MFDLNRWPIIQRIGRRFRSNLYILVCHTNRRPIRNTIGVVTNRLVGMGLKGLVINYRWGGLQNGRGGGGVLAILKGGGHNFGVVLTRVLKVLTILEERHKRGGRKKFYPVLRLEGGGGKKVSDPRFSHFVAPPPSPLLMISP